MDTTQIASLFSGLEATLASSQKFQEANNREYAFEFNPLIHFYGVGENKLSDMLAFFLNPKERHGQGRAFADIFVEHFGLTERIGVFSALTVEREKQTVGQRRLDILLTFDNRFALGIENKFGAGDQKDQTRDYCVWLEGYRPEYYALMYLTPRRSAPTEWSMDQGERIKRLDDKTLLLHEHASETIALIRKWATASKADKVRHFLQDFEKFIHHRLNGSIFMNDKNTIGNYLVEDYTRLKTAIQVNAGLDTAIDLVWSTLDSQLSEVAKKSNLELAGDFDDRSDKYNKFSFSNELSRAMGVNVCFEWEGKWLQDGYVGFVWRDVQMATPDAKEKFAEIFGAASSSKSWPWYKQLDEKYAWFGFETYLDIYDKHTFKTFVETTVLKLLTELERVKLSR